MNGLLLALQRPRNYVGSHNLLVGGFLYSLTIPGGVTTVYIRAQGTSGECGPATNGSNGGDGGGAGGALIDVSLAVTPGQSLQCFVFDTSPQGQIIWGIRLDGVHKGYFRDGYLSGGGYAEWAASTANPQIGSGTPPNGDNGQLVAVAGGYIAAGGGGGSGALISPPGSGGFGGTYGGSNIGAPPVGYWGGGGAGFFANGQTRIDATTVGYRAGAFATVYW